MTSVQELIDGLAERVGLPVGIDDRRFRSVAYTSHANEIDPVRRTSILGRQAPAKVIDWLLDQGVAQTTGYKRLPGNAEFAMVARVCFPLRFADRLLGYLWLVEERGPLSDALLAEVGGMTEVIAQELFRREQAERESYVAEALAVRRLTEGTSGPAPGEATLAAATHHSVALAEISGIDDQQAEVLLGAAAARLRRGLAPRRSLALIDGGHAVLVLAGTEAEIRSATERLLTSIRLEVEQTWGASVVIGVGGVRESATELAESRREAQLALRVARSDTGHGPLAHWEELEAYRLIAALIGTREVGELLPSSLRALLADPDADTLVPTVEAYLEHGGDAAATVGQLFIHRSSLYSRLHRVEKLAGIDMRSGADRLELHLGLRLWRLAQTPGESARLG